MKTKSSGDILGDAGRNTEEMNGNPQAWRYLNPDMWREGTCGKNLWLRKIQISSLHVATAVANEWQIKSLLALGCMWSVGASCLHWFGWSDEVANQCMTIRARFQVWTYKKNLDDSRHNDSALAQWLLIVRTLRVFKITFQGMRVKGFTKQKLWNKILH